MGKFVYPVRPMSHMLDLGQASVNADPLAAQWASINQKASVKRVVSRWDHYVLFPMGADEVVKAAPIFRAYDGTYKAIILTANDAAVVVTGSGNTYRYITQRYAVGTVTEIKNEAESRVYITGGDLLNSGLNPGDKFVLDTDIDEDAEPNPEWCTIKAIDGAGQLTLTTNYATNGGTTGLMSEAYRTRMIYTVPTGEQWSYASVAGLFCFGNGNINVQSWNGTDVASIELNGTYAKQARYLTAFSDRLLIADLLVGGTRSPWTMRWSKIDEPADWTASSAGEKVFIDTEDPITGMASAGGMLFIYKKSMYHIAKETTDPTAPIQFLQDQKGTGNWAPFSLIPFNGTNAFMGINDFYIIDGDTAVPIGDPIRYRLFAIASDTELVRVFGGHNPRYHELLWVVLTSEGQIVLSYDYKEKAWAVYKFDNLITGLGGQIY